jgi:plasmid stabilization system protein ParE
VAAKHVNKTSEAEADFAQAVMGLLESNPVAAERFIDEFDSAIDRIAEFPEWWPVQRRSTKPELAGLRMAVLRRFGYLIFYSYEKDTVIVRCVIHGAREEP